MYARIGDVCGLTVPNKRHFGASIFWGAAALRKVYFRIACNCKFRGITEANVNCLEVSVENRYLVNKIVSSEESLDQMRSNGTSTFLVKS